MRQKKIVHIIHSGIGGTASLFFEIAEADKVNIHIGIAWGVEKLNQNLIKRAQDNNIILTYLPKKKGLDLMAFRFIQKTILKHNPDEVILHSITAGPGVLWAKYLSPQAKKFFLTSVEHTFEKYQTFTEKWILFILAKLSDRIVVFSQNQLKSFQKRNSSKNIECIPHRIDSEIWYPENMPKKNGEPFIIGYHGRFSEWKRISLLAQILAELKTEKVQLQLLGEGQGLQGFIAEINKMGLEDKVEILPPLPADQIRSFLSGLDLWVCFSKGETTGLSALEAIVCRIPVMLSGHSVLEEWIPNEINIQPAILAQKIREKMKNRTTLFTDAVEIRKTFLAASASKEDWLNAWTQNT